MWGKVKKKTQNGLNLACVSCGSIPALLSQLEKKKERLTGDAEKSAGNISEKGD